MRIRLVEESGKSQIFEVLRPSFGDGVRISALSDLDGVCKGLGFKRARKNSVEHRDALTGLSVIVDSEIRFMKKPRTVSALSKKIITRIECMGARTSDVIETVLISAPLHLEDRRPFHKASHLDGVCIALGYKGGSGQSFEFGTLYRGLLHVVDERGQTNHLVEASDLTHSGHEITNVICVR